MILCAGISNDCNVYSWWLKLYRVTIQVIADHCFMWFTSSAEKLLRVKCTGNI